MDDKAGLVGHPPPFLEALWHMLSDVDNAPRIAWDESGCNFEVKSPKKLATDVLHKHFRHSTFSSFQRQLNYYGFHKSGSVADGIFYAHELFTRDAPTDMLRITRKTKHPPSKGRHRGGDGAGGHGDGASTYRPESLRTTPPAQLGTRMSTRKRHRKTSPGYQEGSGDEANTQAGDEAAGRQQQRQRHGSFEGGGHSGEHDAGGKAAGRQQQRQRHGSSKGGGRSGENGGATTSRPCSVGGTPRILAAATATCVLRPAPAPPRWHSSCSPGGAAVAAVGHPPAHGWFCHDPGLLALSPAMHLPPAASSSADDSGGCTGPQSPLARSPR
jgi:hypothetical protein